MNSVGNCCCVTKICSVDEKRVITFDNESRKPKMAKNALWQLVGQLGLKTRGSSRIWGQWTQVVVLRDSIYAVKHRSGHDDANTEQVVDELAEDVTKSR